MKWQDVKELGLNLFKKKSRSRRLWIGGGAVSFFGVLGYLLLLSGVSITTSGDVICDDNCTIYTNITSTYWEICFNDTEFSPLYFDKEPIDYEVFVPARGKDNWRPLKVGDCIKRKNRYNVLPNRFKIVVFKEEWQTIKYGVQFSLTDIDPFLYSAETTKEVNGKFYVQECIEQFKEIEIDKNATCQKTVLQWVEVNHSTLNATQKLSSCPYGHLNKEKTKCNTTEYVSLSRLENVTVDYACIEKETINKSIGCIKTGVLTESTNEYKVDNYFCGVTAKEEVWCDERYDSDGGTGDGNGDGICQRGETCINL